MGKSTQEGGGCMGNVVIESKHVYCLSSSLIELSLDMYLFNSSQFNGTEFYIFYLEFYFQINIMQVHLNSH